MPRGTFSIADLSTGRRQSRNYAISMTTSTESLLWMQAKMKAFDSLTGMMSWSGNPFTQIFLCLPLTLKTNLASLLELCFSFTMFNKLFSQCGVNPQHHQRLSHSQSPSLKSYCIGYTSVCKLKPEDPWERAASWGGNMFSMIKPGNTGSHVSWNVTPKNLHTTCSLIKFCPLSQATFLLHKLSSGISVKWLLCVSWKNDEYNHTTQSRFEVTNLLN